MRHTGSALIHIQPVSRIPLALTVLLAFFLSLAPLALAFAPPDLSISASFGWNNSLIPERWCPIVLTVTGADGTLPLEAFDGDIIVTYDQDATQATALRLHVAGAPGQTTRAQGLICVPRSARRISINLVDARGSTLASATYSENPDLGAGEQLLAPVASTGALLALSDGSADLSGELLKQWGPLSFRPAVRARCERILPADFPTSSAAYDSVAVVIVDAASPIDTRAKLAIREWVLCGGRLLILAGKGGSEWRSWLPPGPSADLVTLGEPVVAPPPPTMVSATVTPLIPPTADQGVAPPASSAPATPPVPAAAVAQRAMSLTDRATDDGWTIRWPLAGKPDRGLLAEGPVGFGWVTILGVEPRRCVTTLTDTDADSLWFDALNRLFADQEADPNWRGTNDFETSSGGIGPAAAALRAVLDRLATVPPLNSLVFLVISLSMVFLAFMVGPGDYLLLRKPTRRHRSWMTALIWIGVACALAYAGPTFLRDSTTRVSRLTAIDAIQSPDGSPALAYQTGVTSIWAGSALRTTITSPDGRPLADGPSDSSMWRGVSGVPVHYYSSGGLLLPTAQFQQRPPGIDEPDDPWGGIPARFGACTHPDDAGLLMRPWTLRAFMDSGRASTPIFATLTGSGDDLRIRLGGIPAGATISDAAVHVNGSWRELKFDDLDRSASPSAATRDLVGTLGNSVTDPLDRSHAARLVGRRLMPIKARLASGRWALLQFELSNFPLDVKLGTPATHTRTTSIRLLVPLQP